jgi:sugar lactone lactonase YvrE
MGKGAEPGAGAIYRYHRGELRRLRAGLTIPNAICFAPDRRHAYFADSAERRIWRQPLAAADGWPEGEPEVWLDLGPDGPAPDGAVCDAAGNVWNAQWGAARVACHAPDGALLRTVAVPGLHASCPAFGGPDYRTLYCTSAREGLDDATLAAAPENGMTFFVEGLGPGLPEPRVAP